MNHLQAGIQEALKRREDEKLLRKLFVDGKGIDFITNDYLGFAKMIQVESGDEPNSYSASRLLGGNTAIIEQLEEEVAAYHGFDAALYFNSGYTANLGLFSVLLTRHDTYIYDEYIHASIRDGIRLSNAHSFSFRHNSIEDLEEKIKHAKGKIVVIVESIYSMDGDTCPLMEISECCKKYNVALIVDEAHSIGVIGNEGKGLVNELKLQNAVFAVVYTYGKAMGTHGGMVCGSDDLKQFLVNYSRPFIYTTAPSYHQTQSVRLAYSLLSSPIYERQKAALKKNILVYTEYMKQEFPEMKIVPSHINKLVIGNVEKTITTARLLREFGFICRPVLSPTVDAGRERIRINLHAFNTIEEIGKLIEKFKLLYTNA